MLYSQERTLAAATESGALAVAPDGSIAWTESGLSHLAAWSPRVSLGAFAGGGASRPLLATCHWHGHRGEGRVLLWDAACLRGAAPVAPARRLEGFRGKVECLHFCIVAHDEDCDEGASGESALMAVASSDGTVRVYDIGEGACVLELVDEHSLGPGRSAAVYACALCARGARCLLATGGVDGVVRVFDAEEGECLARLPAGGGHHVKQLAWSPCGGLLCSAGGADRAFLWSTADMWGCEPSDD